MNANQWRWWKTGQLENPLLILENNQQRNMAFYDFFVLSIGVPETLLHHGYKWIYWNLISVLAILTHISVWWNVASCTFCLCMYMRQLLKRAVSWWGGIWRYAVCTCKVHIHMGQCLYMSASKAKERGNERKWEGERLICIHHESTFTCQSNSNPPPTLPSTDGHPSAPSRHTHTHAYTHSHSLLQSNTHTHTRTQNKLRHT